MIAITIEADDVIYRVERREDGSGLWDWRLRHGEDWGPALDIEMDGRDVLWQVAGMCNPPSVQAPETDVHTDVSVNEGPTK